MISIAPLLTLIFLALTPLAHAQAVQTDFYVDREKGSNDMDCAAAVVSGGRGPCFTIQVAYDKCPRYGTCRLHLADGRYTEPVNVYYQHAVDITGNCKDPSKVVLQASAPGAVIMAQDLVIAIIGCVTLTAAPEGGEPIKGAAGIASRQYAIVDYHNMRFGPFADGIHIALAEKTKANCGGEIEIFGDAAVHAVTADQSFLYMACKVLFTGERKFIDVFQCVGLSFCRMNDFSFAGLPPAGRMFYVDQSRVTGIDRLWDAPITHDALSAVRP